MGMTSPSRGGRGSRAGVHSLEAVAPEESPRGQPGLFRPLSAALIGLELVAELLAFVDRAEARAFHRRDVDENVRAAVVRLDEAKALGGIEPLHCAGRHELYLIGASFRTPEVGAGSNFRRGSWKVR